MNKLLLLILDGWGIGKPNDPHNAIAAAKPPFWQHLLSSYPSAALCASDDSVGLPKGHLSNSEVGHLTIGSGRVVAQGSLLIDRSIADGSFESKPELAAALEHLKQYDGTLHLYGLYSNAGVHAHINHIIALIEWAKRNSVKKMALHLCTDGRDMPPMEAAHFLREIEPYLDDTVELATLCGRAIGMDRMQNWDRTSTAYANMRTTTYAQDLSPRDYIESYYKQGIGDEQMPPARFTDTTIEANDAIIFFNFRADRMRQMVRLLLGDVPEQVDVPDNLFIATMTNYDDAFVGRIHTIFPPPLPDNALSEWLCKKELTQLRLTETEKYAHLTYFMNGGRELEFDREERIMIDSLGLKDYTNHPMMSLQEVTDALLTKIQSGTFDFISSNIANGDMIGHTGNLDAAIKAVGYIDEALSRIIGTAEAHGYTTVITSDHGNIESIHRNGKPHTAHTFNDVPLLITNKHIALPKSGHLHQVAPTVLQLMGIPLPDEMTSSSLVQ